MPNKEFLEKYPLYKKFEVENLQYIVNRLPKVSIKMLCPNCVSDQTFLMNNDYTENLSHANFPTDGLVLRIRYICAHCQNFERYFFIKIGDDRSYIMKIGQYPPWDISVEKNISNMLGEYVHYYKKALICESQSYGIGAFAYYRRIVEEIIGQLLEDIAQLISDKEHAEYMKALEEVRKTNVAEDKIKIVRDLLPPILRPDGMNPLSTLYSVLSEGLHAKSDDDCNDNAMTIREVLIFMANQLSASKAASKNFTEGMKKLLEKKSKK